MQGVIPPLILACPLPFFRPIEQITGKDIQGVLFEQAHFFSGAKPVGMQNSKKNINFITFIFRTGSYRKSHTPWRRFIASYEIFLPMMDIPVYE